MAASLWSRLRNLVAGGASRLAVADLEQVLLEADFGPAATFALAERLEGRRRRGEFSSEEALRTALVDELEGLLGSPAKPDLELGDGSGPGVVLVVGVNGTGKTTTVAKLAQRIAAAGKRPLLAAADTYRAAGIAQLEVWAERLGMPCVSGGEGGDPAAVVFDAIAAAEARGADAVIADTAGRLHTKGHLLDELKKVVRVAGRRQPGAPHEVFLVVDGTTGQNMLLQGRAFREAIPLTGVIVTKLDGTARGGAVVALRQELGLSLRFIGIGESVSDLVPFDARAFAQRLIAG